MHEQFWKGELKMSLQMHCWVVVVTALQVGATTVVRFLGEQHEHCLLTN